MANLNFIVNESTSTAIWQIVDLSDPFNQSFYVEAGITLQNFTNGTYTINQSQIIDFMSAPSTGSLLNTSISQIDFSDWDDGDYIIYGYAKTSVGKYYHAGEAELYIGDSGGGSTGDEIALWDWEESNGSATARETAKAYAAIKNKGNCSDFSYKVWNDMCDKTDEYWQIARGEAWFDKYLSYNDTIMTRNDKVLTADRMNSLKINISGYNTGVPNVESGDPVYGWYFISLMEALNEQIAEYNNEL